MEIFAEAVADAEAGQGRDRLFAALAGHRQAPPDFLAVHASPAHDTGAIGRAAREAGVARLHGATTCRGAMAGGSLAVADGTGIGLFAIWDEEGDYGTGLAAKGSDPRAAGRSATLAALRDAQRPGEAPDLVWLSAAPGGEEAVLAGIEDIVGPNTPIIGGSAADNDLTGGWQLFDREASLSDGVVVSVLFPSRPVSFAYQSGYAPTLASGTVTRAEGRRLHEIDGLPAAEVYARWTGGTVDAARADAPVPILAESTLHPLGRPVSGVYDVPFHLLAHPAAVHPDGSLELFAAVGEGELLRAMTGSADSLTARAPRVADLAARRGGLSPGDIAGALMVYCGGCMMAVGEAMGGVAGAVDRTLGGAPNLGIFTFGEQGPVVDGRNRHGNLMISCVTFSR